MGILEQSMLLSTGFWDGNDKIGLPAWSKGTFFFDEQQPLVFSSFNYLSLRRSFFEILLKDLLENFDLTVFKLDLVLRPVVIEIVGVFEVSGDIAFES